MLLRRRTVIDRDIEKKILTSLITSDKVINNSATYLKPKLFNLDISKRISKWILEYYSVYKEAPKSHIQDIYRQHQTELKEEEANDIKEFLTHLSQTYSEDESINEDYLIDQTLTYLKKLHLLNIAEEVKVLAESDHVEEAEALFRKGVKQASQIQGGWAKPLDDLKFVQEVFTELENPMIEFGGEFGKIINKIYPGWFFAVEAGYKKGKTQFLLQITKECLMARKKVAFVSLEMIDKHMGPQIYKSIGGLGNQEGEISPVPCFDCKYNQDDSCNKPQRKNRIRKPEEYSSSSHYKPCTACRGTKDFSWSTWWFTENHKLLSTKSVKKVLRGFQNTFGKNLFQLKYYPNNTCTPSDLDNALDILEVDEGFYPDLIVIDYADLMVPDNSSLTGREKIDDIWRNLKRQTTERKCSVMTASQINRQGLKKDILDGTETSEDARKIGHVDFFVGLAQSNEEKANNIIRMNMLFHRWKDSNQRDELIMLQHLDTGQMIVDSLFLRGGKERIGKIDTKKNKKA